MSPDRPVFGRLQKRGLLVDDEGLRPDGRRTKSGKGSNGTWKPQFSMPLIPECEAGRDERVSTAWLDTSKLFNRWKILNSGKCPTVVCVCHSGTRIVEEALELDLVRGRQRTTFPLAVFPV